MINDAIYIVIHKQQAETTCTLCDPQHNNVEVKCEAKPLYKITKGVGLAMHPMYSESRTQISMPYCEKVVWHHATKLPSRWWP